MSYMSQIALGPTDPIKLVHTVWGPNCHKSIICQRDAIDCGNEGTQTWKMFTCRVVSTGYWRQNNPDSTLGVIWVISSKLPLDPCTREAIFILIAHDGNTDFTHISVFIFPFMYPLSSVNHYPILLNYDSRAENIHWNVCLCVVFISSPIKLKKWYLIIVALCCLFGPSVFNMYGFQSWCKSQYTTKYLMYSLLAWIWKTIFIRCRGMF